MTANKLRRSLLWLLLALILLPVLAAGGAWLWARASLPQTEGEIALAGLTAPAEILRDADGIVTIRAASRADAAFALGYAHAQDRLWQMDFMRRTGAGRLSEVAGEATLGLDRFMRGLGFYRVAEANLEALSPETLAQLEAYSAGVNAFIEDPGGPLPPEFLLLRYEPEPWRPADSVVWGRLMALQLSGNWRQELTRLRLAQTLTPEQIDFLWPDYPSDAPVAIERVNALLEAPAPGATRLAEILPWDLAPKKASNSWALSGALTATGSPILANDPHLGLSAPGHWYLARIETPDGVLAGVTAPGVPFVIIGRNSHIAWGFTTTEGDTQDLFIERLSESQENHYDTPEGPKPFEMREETIRVRDGRPVSMIVRATRHGPVLSDFQVGMADVLEPRQVMALAWPSLAPDDRTSDALAGLNRARDWDDFLAAMRLFHSPQQTVIYADRSGTIGLVAPARIPRRKAGDGRTPVPGWSGAYDWLGLLPFEDLPQTRDPADGSIVAANNRMADDGKDQLVNPDWRNPYRAERIEALLADLDKSDLADNERIQLDIRSMAAERLLPRFLELTEAAGGQGAILAELAAWDLRMDRRRPEPLIFAAWLDAVNQALLADELGVSMRDFAWPNPTLIEAILTDAPAWCDDIKSQPSESCAETVASALERALLDLGATYGDDRAAWRWGEAHRAPMAHPLFGRIPVLRDLVGGAIETDGGAITVNRGAMPFDGPFERRFEHIHGSGLRVVYDLADLERSRFMIAAGQSGHPLSPHYLGFTERWRDGAYLRLAAPSGPVDRLTLRPH